jgi:hypothetical protein
MATRSAIGFLEYDGSVTGIYCHWDGYLEGVGATLTKYYTDIDKVLKLIDMGDVSSLDKEIGVQHPFSRFSTDFSQEKWDDLYGDMTTFYTRDRGEDAPARDFADAKAFRSNYGDAEFFYLFDGNEWTYATRGMPYFKAIPVTVEA